MKKLLSIVILLPLICTAKNPYGYDYKNRQHMKIYFKNGKVIERNCEHNYNWTCFYKAEGYSKVARNDVKDDNYTTIYDSTNEGKDSETYNYMKEEYSNMAEQIRNNEPTNHAEYYKHEDKCSDYNYNWVNVVLKSSEVDHIEIW